MKKILILFMSLIITLSIAGCADDQTVKPEDVNVKTEKQEEVEEQEEEEEKEEKEKEEKEEEEKRKEEEEAEKNKIYEVGEKAIFKDEDGKEMYSLKINSVNIADKFIEKKDKAFLAEHGRGIFAGKYEQAVEVNYTYTNIAIEDKRLAIGPREFQVADVEGEVGESTLNLKKQPQEIIPGTSNTVEGHHALMNKSDKVKIIFTDKFYNETVIFEVPVSEEVEE